MRIIDADKIKKPIYAEEDNVTGFGMSYDEICGYNDGIDAVFTAIRCTPTIDAIPVAHGRWIETEFPYGCKQYRCSNCIEDEWWNDRFAYGDEHYCPNCGAKMDEEDE